MCPSGALFCHCNSTGEIQPFKDGALPVFFRTGNRLVADRHRAYSCVIARLKALVKGFSMVYCFLLYLVPSWSYVIPKNIHDEKSRFDAFLASALPKTNQRISSQNHSPDSP